MSKLGKDNRVELKGDYEVTEVNKTSSGIRLYTVLIADANGETHELVMERESLYFDDEDRESPVLMG